MGAIEDYYAALDRLANNKPIRLPKGTQISKDAVALEAGRKRSSIKKSRPMFEKLISDIEAKALQQGKPKQESKDTFEKLKSEKEHYRNLYHNALNRELMLVKRIADLERQQKKDFVNKANNVHDILT